MHLRNGIREFIIYKSMRILIICTGNSCRSQMAEGFLRSYSSMLEVYSAGTRPEKQVNPRAISVMKEAGIDISGGRPDPVEKYLHLSFDYVITVCDGARETCPVFTGQVANRLHIGFEDPAEATGSKDEIIAVYRNVRDLINESFRQFFQEISK